LLLQPVFRSVENPGQQDAKNEPSEKIESWRQQKKVGLQKGKPKLQKRPVNGKKRNRIENTPNALPTQRGKRYSLSAR